MDDFVYKDVRRLFRLMKDDKKLAIDVFYNRHVGRNYSRFKSKEQVMESITPAYIDNYHLDLFMNYSGYNFRNINNVLRKRWNYFENGHEKEKAKYEAIAYEMKTFIDNNQVSIGNRLAFRGVSLDYFRNYGVNTLEDLKGLEGNFILDKGFVSTSLIEEECFYKKKNELGINYNVKIEYLIPEEFKDGIYIGNNNLSYSPNQCEYIINAWNIAKVRSVDILDDSAVVRALLVPKKIYDDYYSYEGRRVR